MARRTVIIASVILLVAAGSFAVMQLAPISPITNMPKLTPKDAISTATVAQGLTAPWSLAFTKDGRIFISERPGRIRVVQDDQLKAAPVFTLPVSATGEGGLLGIALHPDFASNGYLYAYYTYAESGNSLFNRVVRINIKGNNGAEQTTILDDIPGASIHNGGRIAFGPDGKLYIATGDSAQPSLAQDINSLAGKILRLNPDGSRPNDNPLPGSLVYSYGHRNPQGLAWHPDTGQLFATEHGPQAADEVNLILPGKNYGWPVIVRSGNNSAYTDPLANSGQDTWAPSGTTFYKGNRLNQAWQNSVIVAGLRGNVLLRFGLDETKQKIAATEVFLEKEFGRLRDVALGPDGALYVLTSNTDGRGKPNENDDKLLRLVPKP